MLIGTVTESKYGSHRIVVDVEIIQRNIFAKLIPFLIGDRRELLILI